jgi:sugar phosphate isomerase/epimerase
MERMKIGLQMYTLRNETAQDFLGTLAKVAALGYEGVEFAGYGGFDAATLRSELDRLGLVCLGSHVSLDRMIQASEVEIQFNLALGSKYIVIPNMGEKRYGSDAQLAQTCEIFKDIGELCAQSGITLGYHNHSFELERKFGELPMLDTIFSNVPASALQVELDACWVHNAGYDPVAYVEKYKGRIPIVHLKDMQRIDGKAETFELGRGEVNLQGIVEAAAISGTQWLVVEQDRCQRPPLESVAISMDWLRANGLI